MTDPAALFCQVEDCIQPHSAKGFCKRHYDTERRNRQRAKGSKAVEVRMSSRELLDEVVWLLDGGMHPLQVCIQLKRTGGTIYKAAHKHGDQKVAELFQSLKTRASRATPTENGEYEDA